MADELVPPQTLTPPQSQSPGAAIYGAVLQRGYPPVQAAALTGNIQRESNFNPAMPNPREGGLGFLQWNSNRLQHLQAFAAQRGTSVTDPNTQLDFIKWELSGPESAHAQAFFGAKTVEEANEALKGYIRYGDNSEGTRLQYADVIAGIPPRQAEYQARNLKGGYQDPRQMGGALGGALGGGSDFSLSRLPPREPMNLFESTGYDAAQAQKPQQAAAPTAQRAGPPIQGPAPGVFGLSPTPPQAPPPPTPMETYLSLLHANRQQGPSNG